MICVAQRRRGSTSRGLKVRTIGEILGWAEDDVEKIIRNQAAQ
jgi:hypothetical protein